MDFNVKTLKIEEFNKFLNTLHEDVCEKDEEGEEFVRQFADYEFALIENDHEEDVETSYRLEFVAKPTGCWQSFKRWLGIKAEARRLTEVATFAAELFETHKGFIQTGESLQHVTDILGRFQTLTEESQKKITGPLGRFERLIADVTETQRLNSQAQDDAVFYKSLDTDIQSLNAEVARLKTGLGNVKELRLNDEQAAQVAQRNEQRRQELDAQEARIKEKIKLMARLSSRAQASFAETPLEPEQKDLGEHTPDLQMRATKIVLDLTLDQLKAIEAKEKEILQVREEAQQLIARAQEEANQLLERARKEASQLTDQAHTELEVRKSASGIIQQAKQEAAQFVEQARAELERNTAEGNKQATEIVQQARQLATQIVASGEAEKAKAISEGSQKAAAIIQDVRQLAEKRAMEARELVATVTAKEHEVAAREQGIGAKELRLTVLERDILQGGRAILDVERTKILTAARSRAEDMIAEAYHRAENMLAEVTAKITKQVVADVTGITERHLTELNAGHQRAAEHARATAERLRKTQESLLTEQTPIARLTFPAFQPALLHMNAKFDALIVCQDGDLPAHKWVIDSLLDGMGRASSFETQQSGLHASAAKLAKLRTLNKYREPESQATTLATQLERKVASSLSLTDPDPEFALESDVKATQERDQKREGDSKLTASSIFEKDCVEYRYPDIPKAIMQEFLKIVQGGGCEVGTYSFNSLRWLYCLATLFDKKELVQGFGKALVTSLRTSDDLLAIAITDLMEASPTSLLGNPNLWNLYWESFWSGSTKNIFDKVNDKRLLELLQVHVKEGMASAITTLGLCHEFGIRVQANNQEAFRLYQLAASAPHNNAKAAVYVAMCYDVGMNVAKDISEARRWCQIALRYDNSCGLAYYILAEIHSKMGAREQEQTLALYIKSAKLGHNASINWLQQHHRQLYDTLFD